MALLLCALCLFVASVLLGRQALRQWRARQRVARRLQGQLAREERLGDWLRWLGSTSLGQRLQKLDGETQVLLDRLGWRRSRQRALFAALQLGLPVLALAVAVLLQRGLAVGHAGQLVLLGGCAGQPPEGIARLLGTSSCGKPNADQQLALNLADEMLNEGRPHASLAHLQQLPDDLDQVRLRKARVLRLLGRSEAEPLYRSLLGGCLAAEGEHGLGQLASARGDDVQALRNLQRAVRLAPTDEKVHNDLGVVLMNLGQHEQARFEFLTAIELKDDNPLPAVNLVTLSLVEDNWQQATDLVARLRLKPAQFAEAQARAKQLKATGRGAVG